MALPHRPPRVPPVLGAPIDRRTHEVLRAATLELAECESRRRFAPVLHAGVPGGSVHHVDDRSAADPGLRADVVLALIRHAAALAPRPYLWLTRPGELSTHDDDLRWLAPTSWAAAALGVPIALVVVTRRGWFDPVSDVRREWRRLRRRPGAGRGRAGVGARPPVRPGIGPPDPPVPHQLAIQLLQPVLGNVAPLMPSGCRTSSSR